MSNGTTDPSNAKQRRLIDVFLVIATVLFLALAFRRDPGSNTVHAKLLLIAGSVFFGILANRFIGRLEKSLPTPVSKRLAGFLTSLGFFFACLFCYLFITHLDRVPSFPNEDGLIANFNSLTDGPLVLNAFKIPFFAFSDSQQGMDSVFSYNRVQDSDTEGYLEIVYQLQSKDSRPPYVGLLTDFADPFPVPYSLAKFNTLKLKVKAGQPYADSPIRVRLILYSANISVPRTQEFPFYEIPKQFLTTEWADVEARFDRFVEAVGPSGERRPLDVNQVYRIGIEIIGPPNAVTHGRLYIDELYFTK